MQVSVKNLLDEGGEHAARVFEFTSGQHVPYVATHAVSPAALEKARQEIKRRTELYKLIAGDAEKAPATDVKEEPEEDAAPALARGNFAALGFEFPVGAPEQVLPDPELEPIVGDTVDALTNLGGEFVEAVHAEATTILEHGVHLPDEQPGSLAKDRRDLRQVVATLLSSRLERGIWQCYLGVIAAEEV